jgi:hypothetical protein
MDIEGFGSTTRTDPIRAGLRRALEEIVNEALGRLDGRTSLHANGDTGDGMWIIFAATLPKTRVVERFVPDIEMLLRHYNDAASTAAQLRLRIGLHHGEVIPDAGGYSGEVMNHAFRIIDNDIARKALSASSKNAILVVSGDFYDKIIKPGFGSINSAAYAPLEITNKETTTIVWLQSTDHPSAIPAAKPFSASQAVLSVDRADQRVLTIGDLPPTSLYVAITDIHNMRLYERGYPEAPIRQQLEAALLLAEKVVIHCADPYRSKLVAEAVGTLMPCVEAGDLLFLLGENAQDPKSHFRSYIDYKVDQYGKSRYGRRDVASLTNVDDNAIIRAEELLNRSPFALIRGFSGNEGFVRCAKGDLQPSESITIREHFPSSIVSRLSLTIRQLLDLTQFDADGSLRRLVADEYTIGLLQAEIDRLAGHNSFSRQILLEAIRQGVKLGPDNPLDEIFEERVSLVHLKGTLGPLTHLEVTSRRDRLSPYYYGRLIEHLGFLAEVPHPQSFGHALVLQLRALPNWWSFASYHLRLVTDAILRQSAGEAADPSTSYQWSRRMLDFESIRSVVRDHWM